MYFVYILQHKPSNKLYIGFTTDIDKRIIDHNLGKNKSTNIKGSWKLIYYEAYSAKKDATKREWNLKRQGRQRDFLKDNIKNSLRAVIV